MTVWKEILLPLLCKVLFDKKQPLKLSLIKFKTCISLIWKTLETDICKHVKLPAKLENKASTLELVN